MNIAKFASTELKELNDLLADPTIEIDKGGILHRENDIFVYYRNILPDALMTAEEQIKGLEKLLFDKKIDLQNSYMQIVEADFQLKEARMHTSAKFIASSETVLASAKDTYDVKLGQVLALTKLIKMIKSEEVEFLLGANIENAIEEALSAQRGDDAVSDSSPKNSLKRVRPKNELVGDPVSIEDEYDSE